MAPKNMKIIALNEKNEKFWASQKLLFEQRILDEVLMTAALSDIKNEELRGVPIYSRKSLEAALEQAENVKNETQDLIRKKVSETQRKRAKKPRGVISADGRTMTSIIRDLAIKPAHRKLPQKKLWLLLKEILKNLNLAPREVKNKRNPGNFRYNYKFKGKRKTISFKTFCNTVSSARKESR